MTKNLKNKQEVWTTSVSDLINMFRDACIVLVPILDRAKIRWKDNETYDDWDAISEGLYNGFLRMAVLNSIEFPGEQVPQLGFTANSITQCRVVVSFNRETKIFGEFIGFSSKIDVFSHVLVANKESDEISSYVFSDVSFYLKSGDKICSLIRVHL